jgi:hypothetical protein
MANEKKADNSANVDLGQLADDAGNTDNQIDLDSFFGGLEKTVNGAIFDDESDDNTLAADEESRNESSESGQEVVNDELETLKKRYADSSKEAKKLASKLKDYQQYDQLIPVLQVMRDDPNLLKQVRSYLEDGSTPQSVIKNLNIPEDFVFDGDEAIKDPNSDSAKVFNAMVDTAVTRRMSLAKQEDARRQQIDNTKRTEEEALLELQKQHGLTDDQLAEFVNWAKTETLTLDHLWFLKNRDKRDQQILNESFEERQKQLEKMKGTPRTLASKNAESKGMSEDDMIFDAILGVANQGRIFEE